MTTALKRTFSETNNWKIPKVFAWKDEPGAQEVIEKINASPNPSTLDQLLSQYPKYKLRMGGKNAETALSEAIKTDNLPLIRHILFIDPDLANGACLEATPYLHLAANIHKFAILKEFINRGADVNLISTNPSCYGESALSVASQNDENMPVIHYLLRNGAVIYQQSRDCILESPSTPKSKKTRYESQHNRIEHALEIIHGENHFLTGTLHSNRSQYPIDIIPAEIRDYILRSYGALLPKKSQAEDPNITTNPSSNSSSATHATESNR